MGGVLICPNRPSWEMTGVASSRITNQKPSGCATTFAARHQPQPATQTMTVAAEAAGQMESSMLMIPLSIEA